jgi:hypothetical protein
MGIHSRNKTLQDGDTLKMTSANVVQHRMNLLNCEQLENTCTHDDLNPKGSQPEICSSCKLLEVQDLKVVPETESKYQWSLDVSTRTPPVTDHNGGG